MWKFGDYKSYTSLRLLAKALGLPSPKEDMDGSQVNGVYWIEKDLDRIVEYCQRDVVTLVQVLLRFHCESLITQENIINKNVQLQS
jgi:predicted PolB exonuclease-like 3'-5' exonuclease